MRTRGSTRGRSQAVGGGAVAGGCSGEAVMSEGDGGGVGGSGGEHLAAPGSDAQGLVGPRQMLLATPYDAMYTSVYPTWVASSSFSSSCSPSPSTSTSSYSS
jgi:hypothetical protein